MLSQCQHQGVRSLIKKEARGKRTYEVNVPRFRPHWRVPRHRIHEIKNDTGIVLRRLHRLLDALRHFGGGERFIGKRRPIEYSESAIRYSESARLISGATLHVW